MKPKLLFSDDNADLVRKLEEAFNGCPDLTARVLEPHELPTLEKLDALYVTFMAAERWRTELVFYESQVLKTRPEDEGWPPYIVTGIALKPDDPRAGNPTEELKLVMNAVLDAIESYNSSNNFPIKNVGFWSESLRIPRMDVYAAGEIIRFAYEEHFRQEET
ncbi:MAG: hypothetical protein QOF62_1072 [Pyrinomonadaceae bacterium]|jgi:hypothetical protein|nr:hypothetical protein [Pyrinomonadaceae bacterium]